MKRNSWDLLALCTKPVNGNNSVSSKIRIIHSNEQKQTNNYFRYIWYSNLLRFQFFVSRERDEFFPYLCLTRFYSSVLISWVMAMHFNIPIDDLIFKCIFEKGEIVLFSATFARALLTRRLYASFIIFMGFSRSTLKTHCCPSLYYSSARIPFSNGILSTYLF